METNEQYTRALKRAQDEGITICGDSIAPNGDRGWSVFNPKNGPAGWYTVRLAVGSQRYTCNCRASTLCKHAALVMADEQERASRKAKDLSRWTVDNLARQRRNPAAPLTLWQ